MVKKSLIWTKFSIKNEPNKPYCNNCKLKIVIKGSSTRNLWSHLENNHKFEFLELKKIDLRNDISNNINKSNLENVLKTMM